MPRVLTCLDPVPASDGSCSQTAFMEVQAFPIHPISMEDAQSVGMAFFLGLATLGVLKGLLKPRKDEVS